MSTFQAGHPLGDRFVIVGVLGMGGVATVYLADDRLRGEAVALKVLHGHLAHSASWRARLRREVVAASRLRHPNALVAADLHELDGILAVSMPLHTGQTLAERVERGGALSPTDLERLARQLADALREAHGAGLLHRDVTATNVMIDAAGDAVLTDFGLARLADQRTATGTGVLGTAGYAAPEVYRGRRSDPRSDLYGLGAVLYHAATGAPAFAAPDPVGTLQRQLADDRVPVRVARPDLPALVADVVDRLLAPDPADRLQTASDVLRALDRALPAEATLAPRPPERRSHLPPGDWTVVVAERRRDRARRRALRWAALQPDGRVPEDTPEHRLADAVAREARLEPGAVLVPRGLLAGRFRLVETVSAGVAHRLAEACRDEGFDAVPWNVATPKAGSELEDERRVAAALVLAPMLTIFLTSLVVLLDPFGLGWVLHDVSLEAAVVAVIAWVLGSLALLVRPRRRSLAEGFDLLPIAIGRDLRFHVPPPIARLLPPPPEGRGAALAPPPAPRGGIVGLAPADDGPPEHTVLDRARAQVSAFADAVANAADRLPEAARRDLVATLRDLRARLEGLAPRLVGLQRDLAALDAEGSAAALDRLEGRLHRIRTLVLAGRAEDDEVPALEHALGVHRGVIEQAEALEGQITRVVACLLETGASAAHARAALVDAAEPGRSLGDLLERLREQTEHARRALAEAEPAR